MKQVLRPDFIVGELRCPVSDFSELICPTELVLKGRIFAWPSRDDAVHSNPLQGDPLNPSVIDGAAIAGDNHDEMLEGEMSRFGLAYAKLGSF